LARARNRGLVSAAGGRAMFTWKRILVPIDFSEHADQALRYAAALARECGARLVMLHVDQSISATASGLYATELGVPPEVVEEVKKAREELRMKLAKVEPPIAGLEVERHLVDGDPAEAILRLASESGCDLIVMGTHGRRGLQRAVLGSVAESVIRRAECPVVTIKLPGAKRTEGGGHASSGS